MSRLPLQVRTKMGFRQNTAMNPMWRSLKMNAQLLITEPNNASGNEAVFTTALLLWIVETQRAQTPHSFSSMEREGKRHRRARYLGPHTCFFGGGNWPI